MGNQVTMNDNPQCLEQRRLVNSAKLRRRLGSARGGQAAVELALIMPVALTVLIIGIQLAVLGAAALSLGQVNYQGARYAATNPSASQSAVQAYMVSVGSPLITANSGSYLTSTLSPAPPCAFGGSVTVSVTLDVRHLEMFTSPVFGVSLPASLSNSETAFCE
jgi:Flp pilus assembly protein TadG